MYPKGLLCKIFQHNKGIKHTKNFKTGGPQTPRHSSDPVPWWFPSTCLEWNSLISIGKNMEIQPVRAWCVYFVLTKLISCTNSSSTFKHMSVFCLSTWLQLSLETNNLGAMGLHELLRQKWFRQRMVWSLVVQAAINAVDEHPSTYINIWIEECLTLFNCVLPIPTDTGLYPSTKMFLARKQSEDLFLSPKRPLEVENSD